LDVWKAAQNTLKSSIADIDNPTQEVLDLVAHRQSARVSKDWATADELRDQILSLGWKVEDTSEGPMIDKL
jgi:cysteinyl-tRNA synthetase